MGVTVWVCVGALAILGRLDLVDRDLLGSWLSERQLPNGGLNGRPEKLEDVRASTHLLIPSRGGFRRLMGRREIGVLFVVEPRGAVHSREIALDQSG